MFGRGPGDEAQGGAGAGGTKPGRGGISRGPGPAWLGLVNDTDGDTDAFEAKRLPPGAPVPRSWERVGLTRGAPDVDPVRAEGPGGEARGGGGEAAWRRRLAPRHREAVRRYFGGGGQEDEGSR